MERSARLRSHVRDGEPLTASKWETGRKMSHPGGASPREALARRARNGGAVDAR